MDKMKRKSFNTEERAKILEKTDCKCGHCGKLLDTNTMTVEHIYPLYKGGTHEEFNLIALCSDCNNLKSDFIYNITDYYKYILPEYFMNYKKCFSALKIKNRGNKVILDVDTKVYKYTPYSTQLIVENMNLESKTGIKYS